MKKRRRSQRRTLMTQSRTQRSQNLQSHLAKDRLRTVRTSSQISGKCMMLPLCRPH